MKRKVSKFFKIFSLVLFLGIICFSSIFYYFFATTEGLKFLINKTNSLFTDTIKITANIESGSVLKGFKTDSYFEFLVKDIVSIRADNFDLQYDAWTILSRNALIVDRIKASKLEVELYDFESEDTESTENIRVNFPFNIHVNKIELKDFAYLSSVVDVFVPEATLSAGAASNYAVVTKGEINNPTVHLKYEIKENKNENIKKKLPEILTFDNGNGAIEKIYDIDLPLDAELKNLKLNHARYYMDGYDTGYFDATVNSVFSHSLLKVRNISIKHPLGEFSVKGTMDFIDYYNMDFNISGIGKDCDLTKEKYFGVLNGLSGKARLVGDLTNLFLYAGLNRDKELLVKARINTLSDEMPFELRVTSDKFSYPIFNNIPKNEPENISSSLEKLVASFSSNEHNQKISIDDKKEEKKLKRTKKERFELDDLFLNIKGAIYTSLKVDSYFTYSGLGFEKVKVTLNGDMNTLYADVRHLDMKGLLSGKPFTSDFKGKIYYKDHKGVDGSVFIKAEDAKALSLNLEGGLSASGDVKIDFASHNDIFVDISNFNSSLSYRHIPSHIQIASLKGSTHKGIDVKELKLTQADNLMVLSGNISDKSNLIGSLSISDFSKISDKLTGSLYSKMSVKGSLDEPIVQFSGRSPSLKYDDMFARKLVFDSKFDIKNHNLNLSVLANNLKLNKKLKMHNRCVLDLNGTLKDHNLSFSCGLQTTSFISASGRYDSKNRLYSGTLDHMMLVTGVIDAISLQSPVKFSYDFSNKRGSSSDIKIVNGSSVVSFSENHIFDNGFKTKLDVKDFDLNSVASLLPENIKSKGTLNISADISYKDSIPNIKGTLEFNKGLIGYKTFIVPLSKANLDLNATYNSYDLSFNAQIFRDKGQANIKLKVDNPYSAKTLSGSVVLDDIDLSVFSSASNQINALVGKLNLDTRLSGSIGSPLLYGKLMAKGRAEPRISIGQINEFDLQVDANGNTGLINGELKLNEVPLSINGNLDWAESPLASIKVKGQSIPVFLLHYGEASVNIDTLVNINKKLSVQGDIYISSALIKFKDIENSTVSPSEDEILITKASNLKKTTVYLKDRQLNNDMSIDVNVLLGDKIKVDAMGLKANAVGSVRVIKSTDSPIVQGQGKVSLVNGRVEVFGHKFIVNKADAIFKKNLFVPYLDAEVVVDQSTIEDDVTAGVYIKGNTSAPQIQLFSKPAMSQNEILSYLLYGHGLEKNQVNTDSSSAQLLLTLGMGTTTGVINSIVGIFGMDGVQLGSSGSGEDTQLEVQTYLTNRIRLSYGYGIYNSVNEFKIRYEIVRKLYAEFISAIDQSIDLIYNFEVD